MKERPGLYLHVPFCVSKCPYCGFASQTDLGAVGDWVTALEREIDMAGEAGWPAFDSLYLGGGTPSALPPEVLVRVISKLMDSFTFVERIEFTMEMNPQDVNTDKISVYKELGVTRWSVGVQSFKALELEFLGRRHDIEQAELALSALRKADVPALCIDLMQGLPGQPLEDRIFSLEEAMRWEPEHISCYELTIEPNTPFEEMAKRGRFTKANADLDADGFLATSAFLAGRGYVHYEVSNYALGGANRSIHNGKYWNHVPYLGLGPAAHSFDGEKRWANVRSVEAYVAGQMSQDQAIDFSEILTQKQLRLERLALGFRTIDGVSLDDLEEIDGIEDLLARLERAGLLVVSAERAIPTVDGMAVADGLARAFAGDQEHS